MADNLHPVQPPAPWTQGVDPRLRVRTGSAFEKKAFRGNDRPPADHLVEHPRYYEKRLTKA